MREFKSLNPAGLPDSFDAEVHGMEPVVEIKEAGNKITVSFAFPGFYLSDDKHSVDGEKKTFQQVNISNVGFLVEGGKPLLPSFGQYVQIPFNCDYEVSIEKGKPVQFDGLVVLPAQELVTDNPKKKAVFEFDQDFYATDQYYPADIVKVDGPFEIDGYKAVLLHVRPFQYNPSKKSLLGFSNIVVKITISPREGETDEFPDADPRISKEAYGNLFLNPRRGIESRLSNVGDRGLVFPGLIGPEFIIIYSTRFKQAADRLAKWKNMRGLRTETVAIGSIGNSVPKIKAYIRKKRGMRLSRLRYVLLFGDVDTIESETIKGGLFGSNITDYYYSTKTDPAGDKDYLIPWLAIGRIPVRTKSKAGRVVDQIIAYEKTPPCDPEYYFRMAFAAYFQDSDGDHRADRRYMKTMEKIRSHMLTQGFDVERVYVSDPDPQFYRDGSPVPVDVKNAIISDSLATKTLISATAEGQLIIGHRDHGMTTGWHKPSFTNSDLDAITSQYPTVFFSINCLTGKFDTPGTTQSFAEKILITNGAAPSLVAATRLSHSFLNDDLMEGLFDAMWAGVIPTFPGSTASYSVKHNRLGDILNYAKTYLPMTTSGTGMMIKDHFEIYHLIGDPTLEIWKNLPNVISFGVTRTGFSLNIKLSECPREIVITIWHKDELLKRMEPSSTEIAISLRQPELLPLLPKPGRHDVQICFWAPGYRFRQINL